MSKITGAGKDSVVSALTAFKDKALQERLGYYKRIANQHGFKAIKVANEVIIVVPSTSVCMITGKVTAEVDTFTVRSFAELKEVLGY